MNEKVPLLAVWKREIGKTLTLPNTTFMTTSFSGKMKKAVNFKHYSYDIFLINA